MTIRKVRGCRIFCHVSSKQNILDDNREIKTKEELRQCGSFFVYNCKSLLYNNSVVVTKAMKQQKYIKGKEKQNVRKNV